MTDRTAIEAVRAGVRGVSELMGVYLQNLAVTPVELDGQERETSEGSFWTATINTHNGPQPISGTVVTKKGWKWGQMKQYGAKSGALAISLADREERDYIYHAIRVYSLYPYQSTIASVAREILVATAIRAKQGEIVPRDVATKGILSKLETLLAQAIPDPLWNLYLNEIMESIDDAISEAGIGGTQGEGSNGREDSGTAVLANQED
jgi:hypothetical protein